MERKRSHRFLERLKLQSGRGHEGDSERLPFPAPPSATSMTGSRGRARGHHSVQSPAHSHSETHSGVQVAREHPGKSRALPWRKGCASRVSSRSALGSVSDLQKCVRHTTGPGHRPGGPSLPKQRALLAAAALEWRPRSALGSQGPCPCVHQAPGPLFPGTAWRPPCSAPTTGDPRHGQLLKGLFSLDVN